MTDAAYGAAQLAPECEDFYQGTVIALTSIPILSDSGVVDLLTPEGAVVVSQTCDVVQTNKRSVIVAPRVRLENHRVNAAKKGYSPQLVHLNNLLDDYFVDLEHCATISKELLVKSEVLGHGVDQSRAIDVSVFAARVGRKFSRFPFPDDVQPWFRPLQKMVQKRHGKRNAVGELLDSTVTLRLAAQDWEAEGRILTLHVIGHQDSVPSIYAIDDDWELEDSEYFKSRPVSQVTELSQIAESLLNIPPGYDNERIYLWQAFAEALANLCVPEKLDDQPAGVRDAVSEINAEIHSDEDFSLYMLNRSASLDLDYLSNSTLSSDGV